MSAVYILWLRELKRYTRSRAQMAASLGQPTLYLLALGFGLGPTFQQAGNGSYLQFLAPGRRRHDDPLRVDLLRRRPAVRSAVRFPEGDAGRARCRASTS